MDRFAKPQTFDRSHAPAIGAPADGLAQGMVYTAVVQSIITEGMVAVTIPALHLSQTFQAHIKPDSNCAGGETCLVEFDEFKTPWVITGSWSAAVAAPPPVVVALPVAPVDGEVINYLADATNGIVWQLRYRAASASAHKWEFVGGSDLVAFSSESHATKLANKELVFQAVTNTPSLTVPLVGDYAVFGATEFLELVGVPSGATSALLGIGTATSVIWANNQFVTNFQFGSIGVNVTRQSAALAAAAVLKFYLAGNNLLEWAIGNLEIKLRPVRVG